MSDRPRSHKIIWFLACLVLLAAGAVHAQTSPAAAPLKKQLPADERAFKAARANFDPELRLAAMRAFLKSYPQSSRAGRARYDIFKILVDTYPKHKSDLETEIKHRLKLAKDAQARIDTEDEIASMLAEAGTDGIELPRAEKLAKHAVDHLSEPVYDQATLAQYAKYKEPPPKPAELHKQFANSRAEALAILADVYLDEGKPAQASPLIAEAYTLDPRIDDVNTMRGRLALLSHDDRVALESFERAQLLGTLKASDRDTMMRIYRQSHSASETGFDVEMDRQYAELFPPPFTPAKPAAVETGHTVLLELFTGSACPPCVGGDLAVDGVLQAYPRSEVVALAFDEHIPEPDPLTNPDSVARADFYDVAHTPNFLIDGELQPFYGSARDGSSGLYDKLTKLVDTAAARPTGVSLKLSVGAVGSTVQAHAVVTLPATTEIVKAIAAAPASDATSSGVKETHAASPGPAVAANAAELRLLVNFALVEDDIRYSGENGIRFHRMVVRSLAKPADSGFPVSAGAVVSLDASFDPAAISRSLAAYLDGYEQQNDKFGKIKFITKDMTMNPDHLAIAVWVQDAVSHHVLDAALLPVTGQKVEGTR